MRNIKEYEGIYSIDTDGNVYNSKNEKKKWKINSNGYARVELHKNGNRKQFRVHRLVAEAYLPNPNNYKQVNHKDLNKLNNSVDNLEWCSQNQNIKHYYESTNRNCIIEKVDSNGNIIDTYWSIAEAAKLNGVSTGKIQHMVSGNIKTPIKLKGFIFRRKLN